MRINFRSQNGFMSQHILYRSQVSSAAYKMRSERVAEGMRRYIFFDTSPFGQVFGG